MTLQDAEITPVEPLAPLRHGLGEEQLWLGDRPRLWAMLHRPYDGSGAIVVARRAVVFCAPFAEEEKCSRRLYVELARTLARQGVTSLRFSYTGACDSEGEFTDFTVDRALEDTRRAMERARQEAPLVAAFGLRLGGTFALAAAGNVPGVERVALWAPITNGRSYVRMNFRRKAIRQMMNTGEAGPAEAAAPVEREDIFDFDGYPVARVLWDQLEGLQGAPPSGWRGQSLVVSVGPADRPAAESQNLHNALAAAGAASQLECVVGQPFWNLLGLVECPEIITLTADWLARP